MNVRPDFLRRLILSGLTFCFLWIGCDNASDSAIDFSPVADFEEQESTMICWNAKHQGTLLPLIATIARNDHVTLFYNEKNHRRQDIEVSLLNARVNIEHITLAPFQLEKDNIWIRDYGPSFLRSAEGKTIMLGFNYPHTRESMREYVNFTDQFSAKMKIPLFKSRLYSAGGGREINGRGTIILVERYEKEINPDLSLAEIEAEYLSRFNQKKVVWLKRGIPQDDFFAHGPIVDNIYGYGTAGHVDEFCRFADPNTILLTEVDSSDRERDPFYQVIHERLEESYRILSQATDQDGRPFRIVRVPQAPVIFAAGQLDSTDILYTPVTSYLNFVITNRSVVIPAYDQAGAPDYVREKDEQALRVFQKVFPTREVYAVNAIELNQDGGGLHCITLPKPGKALRPNGKKRRLD